MKELKVDYLSDMHLSFYIRYQSNSIGYLPEELEKIAYAITSKKVGDVLVVAGDLSENVEANVYLLGLLAQSYKKVFYVLGNHEYYLWGKKEREKYDSSSLNKVLKTAQLLTDIPNVVLLDRALSNGTYTYDGFTIAGDTFWYYPKGISGWCSYLLNSNDHWLIKEPGMSAKERIAKYHDESMSWYDSLPKDLDLIVTHVSPFANPKAKHGNDSCYFNPVDVLKATSWIYGHDHKAEDYYSGDTHLVSNPWGYDTTTFPVKTLTLKK